MAEKSEDKVRDKARALLGLKDQPGVRSDTGQLTTFNMLGFPGVRDAPDGWWLPDRTSEPAFVLEAKGPDTPLGKTQVDELLKNVNIVRQKYTHVAGILYNGTEYRLFLDGVEYTEGQDGAKLPDTLQDVKYYLGLFSRKPLDKEHIFEVTAKINNCLHFRFGIKNLYHRMIFTACALVAKRYNATMVPGMDYSEFHNAILNCLNKELIHDKQQNRKLGILTDVFSSIQMNLNVDSEDSKQQEYVKGLIRDFIGWVTDIADCLNSSEWRGEDVMGIFFNEFNRYKAKSEAGQVFTPEHITDFMYQLLEVNKDDRVFDGTCGSGGFLVKCMANMIREAGGPDTEKARRIKQDQLYGIEFDKEIYALACANMLIHKDGKTNLEQNDMRSAEAGEWLRKKNITKVLMNPPFETKYGTMTIVENVMDHVPPHTACGFILPDKKLEKSGKRQIDQILRRHRLKMIIKLPEDLFFGIGITTSIFVFESGVPQDNQEIFACYMAEDGLQTVKNKGRHDVKGKWPEIEAYWLDSIRKRRDERYGTAQWIKPSEHLSWQAPEKPFELFEEDFKKTALDCVMFQQKIDAKAFKEQLMFGVMYNSRVSETTDNVIIALNKNQHSLDECEGYSVCPETDEVRVLSGGASYHENRYDVMENVQMQ